MQIHRRPRVARPAMQSETSETANERPIPAACEARQKTTGSDTTVVATASAAPQTHWLVAPVSAILLV